jgi:thioesterase domain-containing protein
MDRLSRLEHTLHTEIPLTQAIGLRVAGYDADGLALAAPLEPNINHKDTAFAGSINAVVTLAGWSLIWCILDVEQLAGKIVIQDSAIQYLRPVTASFMARCRAPADAELARFLALLRRKRRARLELRAEIWERGLLAVSFSGRYVVERTEA